MLRCVCYWNSVKHLFGLVCVSEAQHCELILSRPYLDPAVSADGSAQGSLYPPSLFSSIQYMPYM